MVWSSSSVRLAIVQPCIDVKSLMEEYLKFINHAANFVFFFDWISRRDLYVIHGCN